MSGILCAQSQEAANTVVVRITFPQISVLVQLNFDVDTKGWSIQSHLPYIQCCYYVAC